MAKAPKTLRLFVPDDPEPADYVQASDAAGQAGILYVPAPHQTFNVKTRTGKRFSLGFKYYRDQRNIPLDLPRIRALSSIETHAFTPFCLALPHTVGSTTYNGTPCGFFMPLYTGHEGLDSYYTYENYQRSSRHTRSDGPLHIAANLAFAVGQAHSRGIVIGDFNPKNFMVDPRTGIVRAIDIDGMQYKDASGKVFKIDAIQSDYLSPYYEPHMELQRRHDLYAMAILIFRILHLGAHPFMMKRSNNRASSTVHDTTHRMYGYDGAVARKEGFLPSSDLIRPEEISPELAELFTQAFLWPQPPDTLRWYRALKRCTTNFVTCAKTRTHRHHKDLHCYLCALEKRTKKKTRAKLFNTRSPASPFVISTKENVIFDLPEPKKADPPKPAVTTTPKRAPPDPVVPVFKTTTNTQHLQNLVTPATQPPIQKDPIGAFLADAFTLKWWWAWLIAALFALSQCSGSSTPIRPTPVQTSAVQNDLVFRSQVVVVWYPNNVTSLNRNNVQILGLQRLAESTCRGARMNISTVSFYPGSASLEVTRTRLISIRRLIWETLRHSPATSVNINTDTAPLSQHPFNRPTGDNRRRGRSVSIQADCYR